MQSYTLQTQSGGEAEVYAGEANGGLCLQVGCAILVALMAGQKGYSAWLWFFAGLLFPILVAPLVAIGLAQDVNAISRTSGSAPDMAMIKRGNDLAWIYIRIGLLVNLGLTVMLIWMNLH